MNIDSGDEFETLRGLHNKTIEESPIKWSELIKLDELDRVILFRWKFLKLPGSMEHWFDLLINQYSKRGVPLYKRKLRWQVLHFVKVLKIHNRKSLASQLGIGKK